MTPATVQDAPLQLLPHWRHPLGLQILLINALLWGPCFIQLHFQYWPLSTDIFHFYLWSSNITSKYFNFITVRYLSQCLKCYFINYCSSEMASTFDYFNGSACIPASTNPGNLFCQPCLNAAMFKQPVLWLYGWAWLSFVSLVPSFTFSPFEFLCILPHIEEVAFSFDGPSRETQRDTQFRMNKYDIQTWVIERGMHCWSCLCYPATLWDSWQPTSQTLDFPLWSCPQISLSCKAHDLSCSGMVCYLDKVCLLSRSQVCIPSS